MAPFLSIARGSKFLIFGIFIHFFYLLSVLHIYFPSPILQGLTQTTNHGIPPARRLVLFVADGLQAEKAFHKKYSENTKFIRNIIQNRGVWGVSHTRVPTESRVGHVSLIGGTYEDVSAITSGWKNNPVEFDSAFKQSTKTWCWGSPEILSIFDKGNTGNIVSHSYDPSKIDFSEKDASTLDQWVFEEVTAFFNKSLSSKQAQEELNQTGIIFFLHLLGIDTTGHSKKPDSAEYMDNIAYVDRGIQHITQVIEEFFHHDGKTSFILTSDHGMTPWGAHGTGLPLETETPFIAWGSGIKTPKFKRTINSDLQSSVWELEDYQRYDLKQVDISPLMTFLLGVNYPVNSVGILPHYILNITDETKAFGVFSNMKQILVQYKAHEEKAKRNSLFFIKYSYEGEIMEKLKEINDLMKTKQFSLAINRCTESINDILIGIKYYHEYNQLFFSVMANIGFISWICYLVLDTIQKYTSLIKTQQKPRGRTTLILNVLFLFFIIVMFAIYRTKHADTANIIYTFSPLLFCRIILYNQYSTMKEILKTAVRNFNLTHFFHILVAFIGVEFIVLSFFYRGILSIIGIALCILPWYTLLSKTLQTKSEIVLCSLWSIVGVIGIVFPQLPVVTREEKYLYVFIASFLISTMGLIYSFLFKPYNNNIIGLVTFFIILCTFIKMHTVIHINHLGNGLPYLNQYFCWSMLVVLPCCSMLTRETTMSRLLAVTLSLFAIYTLLSISYESLFLLFLNVQLSLWIFMELQIFQKCSKKTQKSDEDRKLSLDDLRVGFMFLYFVFLSFFGTGNIASINSFDIQTTYCFQTVFNPLIQGFLLGLKVLIPFITVILFFRGLQSITNLPIRGMFQIILLLTDIMAINFFFFIKNEGSWLDIGQSVSHFIITLSFIVFLLPVYELSYFVCGKIKIEAVKQHLL